MAAGKPNKKEVPCDIGGVNNILLNGFCPLQQKGCERVKRMEKIAEQNSTKIDKHNSLLVRIDEKLDQGTEKFDALKKYIEGNGQPGMLDRLTRIETKYILIFTVMVLALGGTFAAVIASLMK